MDIKILFEDEFSGHNLNGDIRFEDNDVELDYGLTTLVLISLYTDKRASVDDALPDNSTNRRGWWGDTISETEDDNIGSKLWLLYRSKTTNDVLNQAKEYIEDALDWMIDDGIVAKIEVETERVFLAGDGAYTLGCKISLFRESGDVISVNFQDLWTGQYSLVV